MSLGNKPEGPMRIGRMPCLHLVASASASSASDSYDLLVIAVAVAAAAAAITVGDKPFGSEGLLAEHVFTESRSHSLQLGHVTAELLDRHHLFVEVLLHEFLRLKRYNDTETYMLRMSVSHLPRGG